MQRPPVLGVGGDGRGDPRDGHQTGPVRRRCEQVHRLLAAAAERPDVGAQDLARSVLGEVHVLHDLVRERGQPVLDDREQESSFDGKWCSSPLFETPASVAISATLTRVPRSASNRRADSSTACRVRSRSREPSVPVPGPVLRSVVMRSILPVRDDRSATTAATASSTAAQTEAVACHR